MLERLRTNPNGRKLAAIEGSTDWTIGVSSIVMHANGKHRWWTKTVRKKSLRARAHPFLFRLRNLFDKIWNVSTSWLVNSSWYCIEETTCEWRIFSQRVYRNFYLRYSNARSQMQNAKSYNKKIWTIWHFHHDPRARVDASTNLANIVGLIIHIQEVEMMFFMVQTVLIHNTKVFSNHNQMET